MEITLFSKRTLEKLASMGELKAFKHEGFGSAWTTKSINKLDELCHKNKAPWLR